MEHVMDAFGIVQRAPDLTPQVIDAFIDSLMRFTWLLDARDEVVTNWVNAMGNQTVKEYRESGGRWESVGRLKGRVVLGLRDWRLRPARTRRRMILELRDLDLLPKYPG